MIEKIAHSERNHALLSASGAHRWIPCTPSARLEEQFPDLSSEYAAEGTLAHEIAELKLRKYYIEPISQRAFNNQLNKLKKHELYQEEMMRHTDVYLDYLKAITISFPSRPYVAVEKKIDYSAYVPEGFGTCDFIIIGGDTIYVIDFKYGKGVPVSAEDNSQMKLYALGAFLEYGLLYLIKKVKLVIVQPRLDNISEFTLTLEELLAWGEVLKPIAQKAFNGEGEYVPGEHCKFCRAKAKCRARSEEFSSLADFTVLKPPLLSDEEVGQMLEKGEHIESWIKDLKDYALAECLKGNDIPGWKAVEGRGSRDYVDQDKAFEYLKQNGIDDAILYERVPLTVPKLEKELGKKEYIRLLEDPGHVKKTPGKPTLASITDKRQAITLHPEASEDFSNG